jgi:beta-lactamase superfamily II metal-dependent hydrolase
MSIVKSISVGNGDMFYIKHDSDNFTIIDCCINQFKDDKIINQLITESNGKGIKRFISTHPDDDHIRGLAYLYQKMNILNFYCVKNEATKKIITDDFKKYCELRDSNKVFFIEKAVRRKWMNLDDSVRGSSNIEILWPLVSNEFYINALSSAKNGDSPNNISPIITYSDKSGGKFMWMGDLDTEFLVQIEPDINIPKIDILFAPHHGRDSGKIPEEYLQILEPKIIIIGEAPSEHINYYSNYNTITQNSAGDIIFSISNGVIDIYVSNKNYTVNFLENKNKSEFENYIGSVTI